MKKRLFSIVIILLVYKNVANSQNDFSIKGKIKGIESGFLYLGYSTIRDSSAINKDGSFSFKGKVVEPTSAFLSLKQTGNNNKNFTIIFIEPSPMAVSLVYDDFKDAKTIGSATQNEFEHLNKLKEPIMKEFLPWQNKLDSINKKFTEAKRNKADQIIIDKLGDKFDSIREIALKIYNKQNPIDYKYFADHPQSYITAYCLQSHLIDLTLIDIKNYYKKFGAKVQQSPYGKSIKDFIDKKESALIGMPAKNFSVTDINGDSISLSSYKGNKYVLLDFWASWCVPCRKESPHLKELYALYKEKGLEIIGISDDDTKKDEWLKAVAKDELPWRQILRGHDFNKIPGKDENDIREKFAIDYLPTQILIDKNGVVIGKYGEDGLSALDKKLKELFGD